MVFGRSLRFFLLASALCLLLPGIASAAIVECNSCSDCSSKIASAASGDIIKLNTSITESSVNYCINVSANSITFDCQGNTVDGNDTAVYGIYIYRVSQQTTNVTIRNCTVSDWDEANVHSWRANGNNFTNITTLSSPDYGIWLYYSNLSIVNNINASSNGQYGLYISYSSNSNNISNIIASNNSYGMYFYSITTNNLTDVTVSNNSYGIYVRSNSNNITNVNASGNGWGFYTSTASSNNITNVVASGNTEYGFYMWASNSNNVTNLTTFNNLEGIYLYSSDSNNITNFTSYGNGYGVHIWYDSDNNKISNCTVRDNTVAGIFLDESGSTDPDYNQIWNCLFNNSGTYGNARIDSDIANPNYFNITNQTGSRIIYSTYFGNIGGNYWTNSMGNGYSDTCTDTSPNDGFCDSLYNLTSGTSVAVDYLPLSDEYDDTPPFISWDNPTPPDGNITNNNFVYLNATITDDLNTSAFFDWNRSLLGYWSFEYVLTNGTVYDNSTYGNDGNMINFTANTTVTGKFGNAIDFDGTNDYITIPENFGIFDGNSNFTIIYWINADDFPDADDWQYADVPISFMGESSLMNTFADGASNPERLSVRAQLSLSGWVTVVETSVLNVDTWYHIAVSFNTIDGWKMYEDGTLIDSNSSTETIISSSLISGIGGGSGDGIDRYFNGTIDEVRIYNRALSPGEINTSYNNGLYRLQNNFTDLAEGTYNYTAFAIDQAGNMNSSSRGVTVDVICDVNINSLPFAINQNNTYYCVPQNLYIGGQTAITFINDVKNSTLDCLNHKIDSNDIYGTYGVRLSSDADTKNNIIKNCFISNFYFGIRSDSYCNNNTFDNNTLTNNNHSGIYLGQNFNATIKNSIAYNNTNFGFATDSSYDLIWSNNTAYNNTRSGFYTWNTNKTYLSNNTAYNNSFVGYEILSGYNLTVSDNTAYNNTGSTYWDLMYNNSGAGFSFTHLYNLTASNNTAYENAYAFALSDTNFSKLSNNIGHHNTNTSQGHGIYIVNSYQNVILENDFYMNYRGLTFINSSLNNITGGSMRGTYYTYWFKNSTNNYFRNTNFTEAREIYFNDTVSWFNYNNATTGGIWVNTSVSAAATLNRELTNWNQTLVQWNDTNTTETGITATYNISNLTASKYYNIYNNSVIAYTSQTDSNGVLPSFTMLLDGEREIKVEVVEVVSFDLTGKIIFWENATPVSGANVVANIYDGPKFLVQGSNTTDSSGNYLIKIYYNDFQDNKRYLANITVTKSSYQSYIKHYFRVSA